MEDGKVQEEVKRIPYGMMNFVATNQMVGFTEEEVREQIFSYLLDT